MNEADLIEIGGYLFGSWVLGYSFGALLLYFRKLSDFL